MPNNPGHGSFPNHPTPYLCCDSPPTKRMTPSPISANMVFMRDNLRALGGVLIGVIALMSGCLSIVREILQLVDPQRFPERTLFLASLRVAFIASLAFLWWREKRARVVAETLLEKSKPRFDLSLGDTIWHYRADLDKTLWYLLASVLNRGEPSVTLSWTARYLLNGSVEQMEFFQIIDAHTLTINDKQVTFTNENLTNIKTLESPIQKGQWVGGRILCSVPGNRAEQINAAQYRIEVECSDYTGSKCTAIYNPSPVPVKNLLQHYAEKTQPAPPPPKETGPAFPQD